MSAPRFASIDALIAAERWSDAARALDALTQGVSNAPQPARATLDPASTDVIAEGLSGALPARRRWAFRPAPYRDRVRRVGRAPHLRLAPLRRPSPRRPAPRCARRGVDPCRGQGGGGAPRLRRGSRDRQLPFQRPVRAGARRAHGGGRRGGPRAGAARLLGPLAARARRRQQARVGRGERPARVVGGFGGRARLSGVPRALCRSALRCVRHDRAGAVPRAAHGHARRQGPQALQGERAPHRSR